MSHREKAEADDVRTVVQHLRSLGYEVTAIMGHSKGAAAVLLYAAIYNDVPKVINISGRCVAVLDIVWVMHHPLPAHIYTLVRRVGLT